MRLKRIWLSFFISYFIFLMFVPISHSQQPIKMGQEQTDEQIQQDGLDKNSFDEPTDSVDSETNEAGSDEAENFKTTPDENETIENAEILPAEESNVDFDKNLEVDGSGDQNSFQNRESNKSSDLNQDSDFKNSPNPPQEAEALMGSPKSFTNSLLSPEVGVLTQEYYPSFIYDDRGRKDPFAPVIQPKDKVVTEVIEETKDDRSNVGLSKYELSALKVTAILIGKGKPKALVRDPSGASYLIHENDVIGRNNGVVRKIRSSQIIVVESRDQKDGDRLYTTQVLSVAK